MGFFQKMFGRGGPPREAAAPLYRAIVARGRDPSWYREGQVPDTIDGRFDMIAALTALVLIRIEAEGETGATPSVLLTETFVDDMEATLRQIGIGDYVVGKHLGKMMGAVGGRLGAFRSAREDGTDFAEPVRRNIFHGEPPSSEALILVSRRLEAFSKALDGVAISELLDGRLP